MWKIVYDDSSPGKKVTMKIQTQKGIHATVFSITQTSHFYSISKDLRFSATLKQIVNSSIQSPDISVSEQEEKWKCN